MKFKFIEHTADIQFRAYGKSLEEIFRNATEALTKSICEDKIKNKKKIRISVKGNDLENLLYNYLEELIVLFDSEGFILSKVLKIKIDKKNLKLDCEVVGDSGDYEVYSHVKAITYNEMFVRKEKGNWICQVTLDV
jgi:SHS2 domain-containing protein